MQIAWGCVSLGVVVGQKNRANHFQALPYDTGKKEKLLFLSCQMSVHDPEFRVILIEIKVAEINAPHN